VELAVRVSSAGSHSHLFGLTITQRHRSARFTLTKRGVPRFNRGAPNENIRTITLGAIAVMATSLLISVSADSALAQAPCPANPSNVVPLPGCSINAVACGLNFSTAMTLKGDAIWVTEQGTASSPPAVKQIDKEGTPLAVPS